MTMDDMILATETGPIGSIAGILRMVASDARVPISQLLADRRAREIVRPRQVAMWLARETTTASLPRIGRALRRDHTTILHGCRVIDGLMAHDMQFAAKVMALKTRCIQANQRSSALS